MTVFEQRGLMSFRSKYDKDGSSQNMGNKGEFNFTVEAVKRGYEIIKATDKEDRTEHWDFRVKMDNNVFKVDAKARKALSRGGEPQDEWILLEKTNVAGKPGWLYGEADYISFEQSDCFILCPRTELVALWKEIVDETILARRAEDAKGVIYTRRDRFDIISYVKNTDVKKRLGVIIWEKKNV